ncbi:MAG: PIN domain-containing protein [Pseudomonadota bacterium]|nr:PIN domain-containing protein [Pseudomonadota bacterium]
MRVALDTNVLVYAEGIHDAGRQAAALALIQQLPANDTCVPVQAFGELFNVLTKKASWPHHRAREAILAWRDIFLAIDTDEDVLLSAIDLATDHQMSVWDAIMIGCAARAKCRLLLSEDLQDGFTWQGVTVVNPFADNPHPLLQAVLAGAASTPPE